jgi:hypothetical protein
MPRLRLGRLCGSLSSGGSLLLDERLP